MALRLLGRAVRCTKLSELINITKRTPFFRPSSSLCESNTFFLKKSAANTSVICERIYSTEQRKYNIEDVKTTDEFREIFTVPNVLISTCRRIQFLKLTAMAVTSVGFIFLLADSSSPPLAYASLFGLSFISVIFFVMGKYAQSVVCKLYVNDHINQAKISHLNFIGRRHDRYIDLDQVSTEANKNETRVNLKIGQKEVYIVHINACNKEQKREFEKYFRHYW